MKLTDRAKILWCENDDQDFDGDDIVSIGMDDGISISIAVLKKWRASRTGLGAIIIELEGIRDGRIDLPEEIA